MRTPDLRSVLQLRYLSVAISTVAIDYVAIGNLQFTCCNYIDCHFQCCNYIGCHFHMLSVAIAYVVRCNCLCCLLQLPMLSVAPQPPPMDMFITTCLCTRRKVHTHIHSITVYTLVLWLFAEIAGVLQLPKLCCNCLSIVLQLPMLQLAICNCLNLQLSIAYVAIGNSQLSQFAICNLHLQFAIAVMSF